MTLTAPSQAEPPEECDVVVVGAGIVGLAAARELLLRHPGLRLAVLEKEVEVGAHQTGHSSGVIHAGIYYEPGSLKARLCVEGARLLYAYCEQNAIPHERCGKVIVATDAGELSRLDELERRGRANGVQGLRRLGPAELADFEPHARGLAALHSPGTGIVDFARVARRLADELRAGGSTVATGCEVRGLTPASGGIVLRHRLGKTRARRALFCAGGWSDGLAVAAGAERFPRILPFRGAYLRLRPERRHLVRGLIYPVPDPRLPFLGVHLGRRMDGEVLLGPTALMAGAPDAYMLGRALGPRLLRQLARPSTLRMARGWWRTGLAELGRAPSRRRLVAELARYVPELRPADVLAGPAGVRAQAIGRNGHLLDDFVVSESAGALHVRNAPSPAATSALALGRLIADQMERGPA